MQPNWLPYALAASLALGLADFFVRQAAPRISSSLGAIIYGLCTTILAAIWLLWDWTHGQPIAARPSGLWYAAAVGAAFFSLTSLLYLTFSLGAAVSIASPVIRFGGILVASLLGIVLLGEGITWRYLVGIGLIAVGLVLILTH